MKTLYTVVTTVAVVLAAGAALADPGDETRVMTGDTGAVLAVEDTLGTKYEVGTIDVYARRVPLIEIIRKAQEGERRKYEGLNTVAFNQTIKMTMSYEGKKPRMECMESTRRAFCRLPDEWRSVTLRDTTYQIGPDGVRAPWKEGEDRIRVDMNDDGEGRDLTRIPYYLERLDKFRFTIARRSVRADEVVYEVDFEPLSDFDVLPGGKIWLLTPEYQIVREEFRLKNLPAPWILKSVDLLTRDWQKVDGRWMVKRVTGRVDLGLNFLKIPNSVEFVALFDNYEFNPALPAGLFGGNR